MDPNSQKLIINPLVSITIPAYNCADFIGQAIESATSQTYKNWELITIDDASTDNTSEKIAAFSDTRIRHIKHQTNKGIAETRNETLREARGAYVAVLDGDDVWIDQKKLEAQVSFLEKNPDHVVVGTAIACLNKSGREINRRSYKTTDGAIRKKFLMQNQFAHSSVLIRKTAVEKTAGYADTLAEDFDLLLQLGLLGKLANLSEHMTGYRQHGHGASSKTILMEKAVRRIIKKYRHFYPNYLPALLKAYLRIFLAYIRFP